MGAKTFTYMNGYGFKAEGCRFKTARYRTNGNLAIEIENDEGPVIRVTLNDSPIDDDRKIAVKDYSENRGMANWLKVMGLIDREPCGETMNCFPLYRMTDKMMDMLGELPPR